MSDTASSPAVPSALAGGQSNPFSRRMVLGFVAVGFAAFLLLLYFLAIGDTGERDNDGQAHAASNGLNGFSGLVELLEKQGKDVKVSRSQSDLDTYNLLVLTPPTNIEPEAFSNLLQKRKDEGPTLVILPKWGASGFSPNLPQEVSEKVKEGWVRLSVPAFPLRWTEDLPKPYGFSVIGNDRDLLERVAKYSASQPKGRYSGYGLQGELPTSLVASANAQAWQKKLVSSASGKALVLSSSGADDDSAYSVTFVIEPDLMNNYGMADRTRAQLALELIEEASYYDDTPIVFDLTMNGLGRSTNLLTLAFKPPFLAATLCVIAAMIVIGWRAFKRFGPPAASGPAIAYGKQRLVANGAGLIVRARRFGMLADPYIDLSAQRTRDALGLSSLDHADLDSAIERRLPDEPNFTHRANALRAAQSQSDILRAARALKDLERTLKS
ncbi:MAG: DUF4350 domain-containing protein [Erythrobacter sp.]